MQNYTQKAPILLISGEYINTNYQNVVAGVYMSSGLYESSYFKTPIYIGSSEDEMSLTKNVNPQKIGH